MVPAAYHSVSRQHAKVWLTGSGASIQDVGSSEGTFVNGVRLKPFCDYDLRAGDRITLGALEFDVLHYLELETSVLSDLEQKDGGPSSTIKAGRYYKAEEFDPDCLFQSLTHAEREVVLWIARGVTHPTDVAPLLGRSSNTVRTQLNSVYQKLGVHSRDELLGWLKRAKLSLDEDGMEFTAQDR